MTSGGKIKVVFFGSGPVAANSLRLLVNSFDIEAIITKPSTKLEMGSIADTVPVFAVASRKELDTLFASAPFESKLAILIDFGIIVSRKIIDYFPLGIVNSHFSLLPKLRGADPISFAILEGGDNTGVSLMLLVEDIDEGPLLAQRAVPIAKNETTTSLTRTLIKISGELLNEVLPKYAAGNLRPHPQPTRTVETTYTRKLTKEDGNLDFNKPAEQLEREVRAFIEWPKSRTMIAGKDVIITKASAVPGTSPDEKPGKVTVAQDTNSIYIATVDGSLWVQQLKPAGKNEMTGGAFLAGYKNLL